MPPQLPPAFDLTNSLYTSTPSFSHNGQPLNGYGMLPNLDASPSGSGLFARPIQFMSQANLAMGFYDDRQDETSIATEWTAPLTAATSDSSMTIHSQPSPSFNRRSASPPACYDFVMEDPTNPHGYREKRFRSRMELDKQKEEIRHLKEYGGACLWCYRSKKKCGPSTPCPPCLTNGRKCVRRDQTVFQTNPFDQVSSSPSVNPHLDEILEILQPGPWEIVGSIDGIYDGTCFGTGLIQDPGRL
ncbi:hypothetical protein N7486_010913 [Penicillium sp. IBT 16267x]|nr:hypothetical protein N7486_010913 [Penicillium sp. IBT 16267x]